MRIFIATVTSIAFMIVPSTANATMNDQSNNSIQTCTSSIEDQHHCSSSLQINDDSIVINGTVFTRAEVSRRLDGAISIQERDAVAAAATAVYFIPGIGEVILTAACAVIVAGTVIVAGSWLYNTIMQKLQQRPLKASP